jgi:hypothetical protein
MTREWGRWWFCGGHYEGIWWQWIGPVLVMWTGGLSVHWKPS